MQNAHDNAGKTPDVRWARFILRHRYAVAAVLMCASGLMLALCVLRLRFESGFEQMFAHAGAVQGADSLRESKFPAKTEIIVLAQGDVLTPDNLRQIHALRAALRALSVNTRAGRDPTSFEEVRSALDLNRISYHDATVEVRPLLPEPDAAPLSAAQKRELLARSGLMPWLNERGQHAALLLIAPELDDAGILRLCAAVNNVLARFQRPALKLASLGVPAVKAELTNVVVADITWLFGLSMFACVVILALTFRHPLAVTGPMLVIGYASVWTFGVMAALDVPITITLVYLPAFLSCVAIGDSVHIQSSYQNLRLAGASNHDAIVGALGGTVRPVIYTALTTSCGLLGLLAADTEALRQLGTFAAVAIGFAALLSFVIIPLVLSFHHGKPFHVGVEGGGNDDRIGRFLARASAFTAPTNPRSRLAFAGTLGLFVLLFVASIVACTQLQVRCDPLDWLPRKSALRDAIARYDAELGGAIPMDIVVEARAPASVRDGDFMERIARLRARLLAYDGGRLANNAIDIVSELDGAAAIAGPDGTPLQRPWSDAAVRDLFIEAELFDAASLQRLVSFDSTQTMVRLALRWTDAVVYDPFLNFARAASAEILGARARVRFTGTGFEMVAMLNTLLRDLSGSFALAFLLEAACLAIFLGTLRLGLIALLPNLLPVLLVLGFMGATNIPVDTHTLLLAPIALGVVTDDTAHFMYSVRRLLAQGLGVEQALSQTLQHVGRSIVINGAILSAGFGVYLFASMQSMQRLAVLVMMTIALSLLADLVFTPVLVRLAFRKLPQPKPEASEARDQEQDAQGAY